MARKKGKGKATKKNLAQTTDEPDEIKKAPHTFVIHRGQVGKYVSMLTKDFRKVMEPYTASKLKLLKSNVLKDFVAVASLLNVTHMVTFSKSEIANYMRIARMPRGPTLTFRVNEYALSKDVVSSLKRQVSYAKQFDHHPLLILNNFSGEGYHLKLLATTFQNMFPSINVNKIKLNAIRRCVLLNYNTDDDTIEFRHYTIKVVPHGMSKGVKKLLHSKVPNLSRYQDVGEFLLKSGNLSESEVEPDGPENQVILPQSISSRGNMVAQKSAIRLIEMGPRLKLTLIKVEEGFMDGETLYHKVIKKTQQEIEAIRARQSRKKKLKAQRKKQQEENVRRKQKLANKEGGEDKQLNDKVDTKVQRKHDANVTRKRKLGDTNALRMRKKRDDRDGTKKWKKPERFNNDTPKKSFRRNKGDKPDTFHRGQKRRQGDSNPKYNKRRRVK